MLKIKTVITRSAVVAVLFGGFALAAAPAFAFSLPFQLPFGIFSQGGSGGSSGGPQIPARPNFQNLPASGSGSQRPQLPHFGSGNGLLLPRSGTGSGFPPIKFGSGSAAPVNKVNLIQEIFGIMENRITMAITIDNNLIGRIQSRIDKLQTAGQNTTAAQSDLDQATAALNKAQTDISNLKTQIDTATASANPKTETQSILQSVKSIKQDFEQVFKLLNTTVKALKALSPPPTASGSASPSAKFNLDLLNGQNGGRP